VQFLSSGGQPPSSAEIPPGILIGLTQPSTAHAQTSTCTKTTEKQLRHPQTGTEEKCNATNRDVDSSAKIETRRGVLSGDSLSQSQETQKTSPNHKKHTRLVPITRNTEENETLSRNLFMKMIPYHRLQICGQRCCPRSALPIGPY
jgi:hypothetical protein